MKKFSVTNGAQSYETDSFDEAKSVLESMRRISGPAIIIDNETEEIIDEY